MLMKVTIKDGFITEFNGIGITETKNLDIHTWNIKIEDNCIRCKTFSDAVVEKKSITRFPLKDSTIYLINKINDAYCYQRSENVEKFLVTNNINVVKCMEQERKTIEDEMFSQLDDGRYVRYDKRVFISPSKNWVIVGEDSDFNTMYISKESDFKKFFRDENFLSTLEEELHCTNWNNWNIPEQFRINAEPQNNGFYVCKANNNFIVSYFPGNSDLLPNHFDYAVFNGIGKEYYKDKLPSDIKVSEYRDFYFDPPTGESIQLIYAIDSRYWEKL